MALRDRSGSAEGASFDSDIRGEIRPGLALRPSLGASLGLDILG